MTTFLRLLDVPVDAKATALRDAVTTIIEARRSSDVSTCVFERSPSVFSAVPGSTLAYWAPTQVLELFRSCEPFEANGRRARVTNPAGDDRRFFRLWFEISESSPRDWVSMAKGGAFSRYYNQIPLVCDWNDARRTFRGYTGTPHRPMERLASEEFFFKPGLTYSTRSQRGFSVRALNSGCVFHAKGPGVFVDDGSPLAFLAVLNSAAFVFAIQLQIGFGSYEVGAVQRTPVPRIPTAEEGTLASLARNAWSLRRSLDTTDETTHAFLLPPGLKFADVDRATVERRLELLQAEINEVVFALYGISAVDRATIQASSSAPASTADEQDEGGEEDNDTSSAVASDAANSWLVGVAFGRFDPRLATGDRAIPPEPEPFDPLPSRSPGMYPEGEEPADRPDVLVDDEGHADDLSSRAIAIAERVKIDAPENLREWFAKDFFPLHIKMYSKSRRKAPIYWQLATPSASYSVWLYIHALSKDTLFRVQNDYVAPKLAHEERRLESLTSELRDGATAAQRKTLAAQEAVVDELRAFLDEVKCVAPLWKPNLDDGVIINFAPLWRLVPHNKSWQKELRSTWDALCDGKYDWAHLAMHLWTERVVPKCAKDRSIAIAHGLEDVFWVEGTGGRWNAR